MTTEKRIDIILEAPSPEVTSAQKPNQREDIWAEKRKFKFKGKTSSGNGRFENRAGEGAKVRTPYDTKYNSLLQQLRALRMKMETMSSGEVGNEPSKEWGDLNRKVEKLTKEFSLFKNARNHFIKSLEHPKGSGEANKYERAARAYYARTEEGIRQRVGGGEVAVTAGALIGGLLGGLFGALRSRAIQRKKICKKNYKDSKKCSLLVDKDMYEKRIELLQRSRPNYKNPEDQAAFDQGITMYKNRLQQINQQL